MKATPRTVTPVVPRATSRPAPAPPSGDFTITCAAHRPISVTGFDAASSSTYVPGNTAMTAPAGATESAAPMVWKCVASSWPGAKDASTSIAPAGGKAAAQSPIGAHAAENATSRVAPSQGAAGASSRHTQPSRARAAPSGHAPLQPTGTHSAEPIAGRVPPAHGPAAAIGTQTPVASAEKPGTHEASATAGGGGGAVAPPSPPPLQAGSHARTASRRSARTASVLTDGAPSRKSILHRIIHGELGGVSLGDLGVQHPREVREARARRLLE